MPCAPLLQIPTSGDRNIFERRSSERRSNEASGRRSVFERSEQLERDAQAPWIMDQVNWNYAHYSTDQAGSQRQRMHTNDELQMQLLEVRQPNQRLIEKRELSRQHFKDHSNEIDDLKIQRATERKIDLMAQIEEARITKKRLEDGEQLRDQLEQGNRWKLA